MTHKSLLVLAGALLLTAATGPQAIAQSETKVNLEGGATLFAVLDTPLDSKKAKVDEQITARLSEPLKTQNKVVFPNGTKLIGRVMQSLARGKGDADSLLGIQFERAILKGGEEVAVRLAIKAIAPPRQHFSSGDSPGLDPLAGTHAGTMTSPMGSSRGSSVPNRDAGNAGGVGNGTDSSMSNDGQLTPESHGVYGMSGVRLTADVSKPVPVSIVSSNGKNLRLDSGTRLLLVSIADLPAHANP